MKPIVKAGYAILLTSILGTAWWLAGQGDVPPDSADIEALPPRDRGPLEAAFCGPLRAPMPPPPMDSPYGMHLYADIPKGVVHALPAMEIVDSLPVPQGVSVKERPKSPVPKNETCGIL